VPEKTPNMSGDMMDVVIVGAGPAGVTAAVFLARKGRQVVLVDRERFPRQTASAAWLNARGKPLLGELGVPADPLLSQAFCEVTFYRADFSQTARPTFKEAPGYLIDRTEFANALVAAATAAGVTFMQGCEVTDVRIKESSVLVELPGGRSLNGRLLLLASGRGSPLLDRVGFRGSAGELPIWTAQVDAELTPAPTPREPRFGIVLGLNRAGSFGLCSVSSRRVSVVVNWLGKGGEAISVLVDLCRRAFENKVVPLDLSTEASKAQPIASPAAAALDMESHVGKHTLAIGDAGGFVSAASNEGIYPAMWSGQIAAEVVDKALRSVHSQDELMTFDSMWRMQMADYLRSPHTDVQFLLPLIFTNQPMADRMGAAFFSGENI
jgi:flavin-dependent dehydrogenase